MKSLNLEIIKFWNYQSLKSSNYEIIKFWNHQILKSSNFETINVDFLPDYAYKIYDKNIQMGFLTRICKQQFGPEYVNEIFD